MLRSIAWMTLVLALVVVGRVYDQQSFDQNARNIAATSDRKVEVLEESLHTVDDAKLEDLRDLAHHVPAQHLGEQSSR